MARHDSFECFNSLECLDSGFWVFLQVSSNSESVPEDKLSSFNLCLKGLSFLSFGVLRE